MAPLSKSPWMELLRIRPSVWSKCNKTQIQRNTGSILLENHDDGAIMFYILNVRHGDTQTIVIV